VHEPVGGAEQPREVLGPCRARRGPECRHELLGSRPVVVHDVQHASPELERGVGDRRPGTARTHEDDLVDPCARHALTEALGEARPVGVVADGPPLLEDDRVHRAHRRRLAGELVDVLDDPLLAGMRHVDAAQAVGAQLAEHGTEVGGGEVERLEVVELVRAPDPEGASLLLVQRRAEGLLDARADEADAEVDVVIAISHALF